MGAPWLDSPVMLHSSRMDHCKLNPEQCAYRNGFWRYWYQSDHRFALTTVYFVVGAIGLITVGNVLSRISTKPRAVNSPTRRIVAVLRYFTYRSFRLPWIGSYTSPLSHLLLGAAGTIFFFGLTFGPKPYYWPTTASFGNSPPLATRTGWMAVALLPFVLALAAKANLITVVTGISHERLQIFHQWASHAMFLLALIHTFPFIVYHIDKGDMVEEWNTSVVYWTGVVALLAQAYLTVFSIRPIRARFYEFFKATHYLAALIFVLFFFFHCDFRLTSWDYFIATGVIYVASLLYSNIRTYLSYGVCHIASLSTLPGGFVEAIIPIHHQKAAEKAIPTGFTWSPGQHVFLRFMGLGIHSLSSHPFTICSVPPERPETEPQLRFIIKPARGLTGKLAQLADEPSKAASFPVLLDGPYGDVGAAQLFEHDNVILIAGGSGVGFAFPLLEYGMRRNLQLLAALNKEEAELQRHDQRTQIQMIVTTRVSGVKQWFISEVEHLLKTYGVTDEDVAVQAHAHLTARGAQSPDDPEAMSKESGGVVEASYVDLTRGRPDVRSIIRTASRESGRSVAVVVCGPAELLYDVRNAVAQAQLEVVRGGGAKEVYLHSEHFS
ncbi:ferric-chelate reductase [Phyllosticta citriasiana]|uniref:ferric-chelate reductase n=1 Tax=Phyllosticta citriasiana TaxID=595635 RepID=UPI0030FD70D7